MKFNPNDSSNFHLFSEEEFKKELSNALKEIIIERCYIRKDDNGKLLPLNSTDGKLYLFLPALIDKKDFLKK